MTFNVKATTSSTECGTYSNTVGATGDNTGSITDKSATVTCRKPDVTLSKTTSTPAINAGDVAKFQVTITNAGPGTATDVAVEDLLPAGPDLDRRRRAPRRLLARRHVVVDSATRQKVTCTFATLGVTSITFNVKATTTTTECGSYANTVTGAAGNQGDLTPKSATVTCREAEPDAHEDHAGRDGRCRRSDQLHDHRSELRRAGTAGRRSGVVIKDDLPGGVRVDDADSRLHDHRGHRLTEAGVRRGRPRRR